MPLMDFSDALVLHIREYAGRNRGLTRPEVRNGNENEIWVNPAFPESAFFPAIRRVGETVLRVDLMPYLTPEFHWNLQNQVLVDFKNEGGPLTRIGFEVASFRGEKISNVKVGDSGVFSRLGYRYEGTDNRLSRVSIASYGFDRTSEKFIWQGNRSIACYKILEYDVASDRLEWIRRVSRAGKKRERYLHGVSAPNGEVMELDQIFLNFAVRTQQTEIGQVRWIAGEPFPPDLNGLSIDRIFPRKEDIDMLRGLSLTEVDCNRVLRESVERII